MAYNYNINLTSEAKDFTPCTSDCGCVGNCAEEDRFIDALFASVAPISFLQGEKSAPTDVRELVSDLSTAAVELSVTIGQLADLITRLDEEGRL